MGLGTGSAKVGATLPPSEAGLDARPTPWPPGRSVVTVAGPPAAADIDARPPRRALHDVVGSTGAKRGSKVR